MQKKPVHANKHLSGAFGALIGLCIGAALATAVVWNMQTIIDWWRLRGYTPDASIVMLANDSKMTDSGRHLFYVNHPRILTGSTFSVHCKNGAEKTVVLGCYESGDRGIYLYDVTDQRLKGVVETTAAHEMLHSAYDRLSQTERVRIDALLNSFYTTGLKDERVKQTVDAYRQSEPTELSNEMHSIFATEVAVLPPELETYYTQYFANRGVVVAMAERYQGEFTSRRDKTTAYDAQLGDLKKKIEANQANATAARTTLENESTRMQSLRRSGDDQAYNQLVGTYNARVGAYNNRLSTIREQIEQYNQIVEQRNAVALEERDLAKALSGDSSAQ